MTTASCHSLIRFSTSGRAVKDIDKRNVGIAKWSDTRRQLSGNKKCSDESGEFLVVGGNHRR